MRILLAVSSNFPDNPRMSLMKYIVFIEQMSPLKHFSSDLYLECNLDLLFCIVYCISPHLLIELRSSQLGSRGGVVVKLLACRARGSGLDSRPRRYDFRDWLSPASKSQNGWNIAKATSILKTTNQQYPPSLPWLPPSPWTALDIWWWTYDWWRSYHSTATPPGVCLYTPIAADFRRPYWILTAVRAEMETV